VHETISNSYGLPYFKLALSHKALARVDTVGFRCRSDGHLYERGQLVRVARRVQRVSGFVVVFELFTGL
jgi:hypothetical protein